MEDIIGTGTYSSVCKISSPGGKNYAMKCNYRETGISNSGCTKELDILMLLTPHSYISSVNGMCLQGIKSEKIIKGLASGQVSDIIHTIFNIESMDLHEAIYSATWCPKFALEASMQLLIALEHCHNLGVMHRDVKPENILVSFEDVGVHCRLCDFGLAKPYCEIDENTPLVQTLMYRPPEVAMNETDYCYKNDIWAAGCTIFEMFTGKRLIMGATTDDTMIQAIIRCVPIEEEDVPKKYKKSWNLRRRLPRIQDFKKILRFSAHGEEIMQKNGINLNNLADLLSHLLEFNKEKRYSATQAINHDFFEVVRKNYSRTEQSDILQFTVTTSEYHSEIRDIALRLCKDLSLLLYESRALFHALEVFDTVIENFMPCPKERLNEIFVNCFYLLTKYFPGFRDLNSFTEFKSKLNYLDPFTVDEDSEKQILLTLEFQIYRITPYELLPSLPYPITGRDVQTLFKYYLNMKQETANAREICILALEGRK